MLHVTTEEFALVQSLAPSGAAMGALHVDRTVWRVGLEGISLSVEIDGHDCFVWLPLTDWRACCEALAGVAELDALDPLLSAGIVEWALSPLLLASEARLSKPVNILPCSLIPQQVTLTFCWSNEHQPFRALLFGWPDSWYARILSAIAATPRVENPLPVLTLPVYIGGAVLTLSALEQVQVGCGIKIVTPGDPAEGEFLLSLSPTATFGIVLTENEMQLNTLVEDIEGLLMQEQGELYAEAEGSLELNMIPQTVLVEVGSVEVSLGAIRTLAEGDILCVEPRFPSQIRLKLNGRTIGSGELVVCNDSYCVRVTKWYLSGIDGQ
jgi:type III secretion protein Q